MDPNATGYDDNWVSDTSPSSCGACNTDYILNGARSATNLCVEMIMGCTSCVSQNYNPDANPANSEASNACNAPASAFSSQPTCVGATCFNDIQDGWDGTLLATNWQNSPGGPTYTNMYQLQALYVNTSAGYCWDTGWQCKVRFNLDWGANTWDWYIVEMNYDAGGVAGWTTKGDTSAYYPILQPNQQALTSSQASLAWGSTWTKIYG